MQRSISLLLCGVVLAGSLLAKAQQRRNAPAHVAKITSFNFTSK